MIRIRAQGWILLPSLGRIGHIFSSSSFTSYKLKSTLTSRSPRTHLMTSSLCLGNNLAMALTTITSIWVLLAKRDSKSLETVVAITSMIPKKLSATATRWSFLGSHRNRSAVFSNRDDVHYATSPLQKADYTYFWTSFMNLITKN